MKIIAIFGFLLLSISINAQKKWNFMLPPTIENKSTYIQDKQDKIHPYLQKDSALIRSDVDNIRYCMKHYFTERRLALIMSIAGTAFTYAGTIEYIKSETMDIPATLTAGAILSLTSWLIYIDAEKWLKRSSLQITPGGIKITF